MMFGCHIAFALALLALVAGGALLAYSSKIEACCKSLVKGVAYVALVLAALNLLCLTYMSIKNCGDGGCGAQQCPMKMGNDRPRKMHKGGMPQQGMPMMNPDGSEKPEAEDDQPAQGQ